MSDFWPSFGVGKAPGNITTGVGSLAANIVRSYGLRCKTPDIGGNLTGLDIKHGDALNIIKMSLVEDSIGNRKGIYEAFVDYGSNSIEFKEVGGFSAGIGSDIYHQIQTGTYIEACSGVMIHGKDPLPVRQAPSWESLLKDAITYDCTAILENCNLDYFKTFVVIVLKDPHIEGSTYANGIDNFYNIGPFDALLGYAISKYSPDAPPEATIIDVKSVKIPLKLGKNKGKTVLGELAIPPIREEGSDEGVSEGCFTGQTSELSGVEIDLKELRFETEYGDTVDKFIGISGVYIVGREITTLLGRMPVGGDDESAREIWGNMDEPPGNNIVVELTNGIHYIINYKEGVPSIVFADRSKLYRDKATYGDDVSYKLFQGCRAQGAGIPQWKKGSILPTGNFAGLVVEEVWAIVDLDTPGIEIRDPNGNADKIAESLVYDMAALVAEDQPPPIAFTGRNGTRLIDQASAKPDTDPTTQQDLQHSDYENALLEMDAGGGLDLTFSFMDESDCQSLSSILFKYMNGQDGVEIVYTCGPNTNPLLGGYTTGGGVVNSIVHQYSDSGSYTVSVTESGRLISDSNLSGITGGPTMKAMENISVKGTIVDDSGDHVYYQVRLDGMGTRLAINMNSSVLRVGDKVSCTIHNNPVEL